MSNQNNEKNDKEIRYLNSGTNILSILAECVPTNNFIINGDDVSVIDVEEKTVIHLSQKNFFNELYVLVEEFCNYYSRGKNDFEVESFMICLEKILRYTECKSKYYDDFYQNVVVLWEKYKVKNGSEKIRRGICDILKHECITEEEKKEFDKYIPRQKATRIIFAMEPEDKKVLLNNLLGKEEFEQNKSIYLKSIISDEKTLKKLIKNEFITQSDIEEYLSQDDIYDVIKNKKNTYLIKYLDTKHTIMAYVEKIVNRKELAKLDAKDFVIEGMCYFSKDELVDLLIKNKSECKKEGKRYGSQDILWELYEKDYFTEDDMDKLTYNRLVNPETVIQKYVEEKSRKIKAQIKAVEISDEKMVKYLKPDRVFSIIDSDSKNKEAINFIKTELKNIYASQNCDFEKILIEAKKEEANKRNMSQPDYMYLYENGLVEMSSLADGKVNSGDIEKSYRKLGNNKILVDAYNCGLYEACDLLAAINEDQKELCSLIKNNNLNPSILNSFYSTYEILKLYNEGNIEAENLLRIKENIDVDDIKKLYVEKKLALDVLLELENIGFITENQSEQFQSEYNMKEDYEKLVEMGRVIGFFGDEESKVEVEPKAKKIRVSRGERKLLSDKIGAATRKKLFKLLGADDIVLPVEGDIWERAEGNELYTILDKKIAYIEPKNGRELTFAVPLRVILEYATGGDDIISNAKSKRDLTKNPLVKAYKHSAQWGLKTVEAAVEMDENFAKTKPTKEQKFKEVIQEISEKYKKARALEKSL